MIKKMLKKISKGMLIAGLLFTGVTIAPMKTNAEEMQSYSSAVNAWTETKRIYVDMGSGGTLYIIPKFNLMKTQIDTTMHYANSVTYELGSAEKCEVISVTVREDADYCSLNTTNYMIIDFKIKATKGNKSVTKTLRTRFFQNNLDTSYFL